MAASGEQTQAPLPWKIFYRQLSLLILATHSVGALVSFMYFSIIDPLPAGERYFSRLGALDWLFFGLVTLALFGLSQFFSRADRRSERELQQYYERRLQDRTCDVPQEVLRSLLNLPWSAARMGLVIWLVAGVVFAGVAYSAPGDMLRGFIGIVGVGGILTTAVIFLGVEQQVQRLFPSFFPDGRLGAVRGAHRLTVPVRLLLVFLLSTLYPVILLMLVSLNRARQISISPNPQALLDNLVLAEMFIVAAAAGLAYSFALFITRGLVQPLGQLQEGMQQVSKNDLQTQVMIRKPDELGALADGFNDMVMGLRQREQLRNLLDHYVSPEVARMALDTGAPLGGQLVRCTILFSDLRNFTGISEKLAPQAMIELLNQYMCRMVDVIVAHGGIVTRFGGDSILAVFGTPLNPHPDHALRAVQAALAMQRALAAFNQGQAAPVDQAGADLSSVDIEAGLLKAGIGIATGEVVAGNVGGRQRMEYTVIGDPANLAARLQTMTKELGCAILLHGETYHAARQTLPLEAKAIPPLAVRGKRELVEAYVLL